LKSERGPCTERHAKTQSSFVSINKDDIAYRKNSVVGGSGKLIKKISKLFDEQKKDSCLIEFLKKKGTSLEGIGWDKFVSKVNKFSNIVYIFIGKTKIMGAFHAQKINISDECNLHDE
jgi:hypothetical protein